jgi:hypothetical protein
MFAVTAVKTMVPGGSARARSQDHYAAEMRRRIFSTEQEAGEFAVRLMDSHLFENIQVHKLKNTTRNPSVKSKIKRGALDLIVRCESCGRAIRESWLMGKGCLKCQGREDLPTVKPSRKAKKNPKQARKNNSAAWGEDLPDASQLVPGVPVEAIASRGETAPVIVKGPDGPLREPSGKLLIIGTVLKGPDIKEQVGQIFAEFQTRWEALQNPRRSRKNPQYKPVGDPPASNAGPFQERLFPYGMKGYPAEYVEIKKNPRRSRKPRKK